MREKNLKNSIRKFSKIVAIVVGVSMLYGAYTFVKHNLLNAKQRETIATVNGEKIYRDEYLKEFQQLQQASANALAQQKERLKGLGIDTSEFKALPDELLKEYLIKSLIDRKILVSSAKDLKVKVSNADVNKQVDDIQKQAGGKDRFVQYITANGYNLTTFKEQLKSEMTISKVQEKIQEQVKISDEEIKKTYERYKYFGYEDQTFEEVKEQIKSNYKNDESSSLLSSYILKQIDKANIKFTSDEYKKIYENTKQVIAEKEGYKFTKSNLNENIIQGYFSGQGAYSDKILGSAKAALEKNLEKLIEIMKKAKEAGIKSNPELVGLFELGDYSKKYYNHIVDTYKPSDEDMLARFNANRNNYNIQNTINGYVLGQDFTASTKDWEILKTKADELKKVITKDNFAAKAKELSQDPGSVVNGGSLGENVDISGFVPEFAQAIKQAKAGEIVGPVKTTFGYHIIYIQSKDEKNENIATVSHILLTPSISEESKNELVKKLSDLKGQLDAKKVSWEQVNTQDKYNYAIKEQFKKLNKSTAIPGIGVDSELSEKLFAAKVGETLEYKADFGAFLLIKVKEIPFKEVTFEEVKERIRLEFAFEEANKVLGNIY